MECCKNMKNLLIRNTTNLISLSRLSDYTDEQQHFDNLKLVGQLTLHISHIEIFLRNLTDHYMKDKFESNWLHLTNNEILKIEIEKISSRYKKQISHDQVLSNLTLGQIVRIIQDNRLQSQIFLDKTKNMKMKKYFHKNTNRFYINSKREYFSKNEIADIYLSLFLTLRNRSYHWENILKTNITQKGEFPRITTKIHNKTIGLKPNNIKSFLDDMLNLLCDDCKKVGHLSAHELHLNYN